MLARIYVGQAERHYNAVEGDAGVSHCVKGRRRGIIAEQVRDCFAKCEPHSPNGSKTLIPCGWHLELLKQCENSGSYPMLTPSQHKTAQDSTRCASFVMTLPCPKHPLVQATRREGGSCRHPLPGNSAASMHWRLRRRRTESRPAWRSPWHPNHDKDLRIPSAVAWNP